ncbi:MAG TPA: type II secretion system protein N [Allosphingosinicella sp.]
MSPRTERLLGRLPRPTVYTAAEMILLGLVAVQCARLIWILAVPPGTVGDWRAPSSLAAPADSAILAGFDPFFRISGPSGPVVVTALNLKLYGVRQDQASGRGSAIIALPDGRQMSFAVGEEIVPGVTLTQVAFDSVTISRNGAAEQIFLDQSTPAAVADTVAPPATGAAPPTQVLAPPPPNPAQSPAAAAPGQPLNFQPRTMGGRVTGIIVSAGADDRVFRNSGFVAGDVIVSVNNQRVTSLEQARAALGRSGGEVNVLVDRGGQAIPLRVRFNP